MAGSKGVLKRGGSSRGRGHSSDGGGGGRSIRGGGGGGKSTVGASRGAKPIGGGSGGPSKATGGLGGRKPTVPAAGGKRSVSLQLHGETSCSHKSTVRAASSHDSNPGATVGQLSPPSQNTNHSQAGSATRTTIVPLQPPPAAHRTQPRPRIKLNLNAAKRYPVLQDEEDEEDELEDDEAEDDEADGDEAEDNVDGGILSLEDEVEEAAGANGDYEEMLEHLLANPARQSFPLPKIKGGKDTYW